MTITADNVAAAEGVEVPPELLATANDLAKNYIATVTEKLDAAAAPSLGEPQAPTIVVLGDFDVLATTPIQFINDPPFKPGKIIAGGELALIVAIVRITAFNKTVLSGRTVRVNLERVNLTNVTDVAPQLFLDFHVPTNVPDFTPFFFFFVPQAPTQGKPNAIEAIVTADVLDAAMPYAAFATAIFDFDENFGPRVNELNRYLVYKK
jgi:hypothetical protein